MVRAMAKKKHTEPRKAESNTPSSAPAQQEASINLGINPELPTAMFDTVQVSVRGDAPLIIMSFLQRLPGLTDRVEIFRGVTTLNHGKKFVDVLVKGLDYYPER